MRRTDRKRKGVSEANGRDYTGWAKKTGPLCSAEILLRSARFFAEIKVV